MNVSVSNTGSSGGFQSPHKSNSRSNAQHTRDESLVSGVALSSVPMHQQPSSNTNRSNQGGFPMPPIPQQHLQAPHESRNHSRKGSKVNAQGLGGGLVSTALVIGSSTSSSSNSSTPQARLAPSSQSSISQNSSNINTQFQSNTLPPNSIHQGFLNRNTNLSLTLNQLNHSSSQSGEKDISKGWKPYRVVLERDGKLMFYKPGTTGNVLEEVKNLFPTSVVRADNSASANGNAAQYAKEMGLDAESIKRQGLGTQDLLNATGSNSSTNLPPLPLPKSSASISTSNSTSLGVLSSSASSTSSSPSPVKQSSTQPPHNGSSFSDEWSSIGRHQDLKLVNSKIKPRSWGERIESGSLEGLAHEFVHATQIPEKLESTKEKVKEIDSFLIPLFFNLLKSNFNLEPLVKEISKEVENILQAIQEGKEAGMDENRELKNQILGMELDLKELKIRIERLLELIPILLSEIKKNRSGIVDELESLIRKLWNNEDEKDSASSKVSSLWEIPSFDESEKKLPIDWSSASISTSETSPSRNHHELSELSKGRFSESVLLKLEPTEIAEQIQVFHSERFRALVVPHLSASQLISEPNASDSLPLVQGSGIRLFSFDSTSPHFLTKLILDQIFSINDSKSGGSGSMGKSRGNQSASQMQYPPAKRRAFVIRQWVRVATLLLSLNDINGWLAISTALCSRSVSRLEQSWRAVPQVDRLKIGKVWAPQLARLGWIDGLKGNVKPLMMNNPSGSSQNSGSNQLATIPYFGDISTSIQQQGFSSDDSNIEISAYRESGEKLFLALKVWSSEWSAGKNQLEEKSIQSAVPPKREYQLAFQLLAGASSSTGTSQYLQASLKVEPRTLGNVDLRWKPPQPEKIASNSFVPLQFSQPLPHLQLTSKDSNSTKKPREDQDGTISARSHNRPALINTALGKSVKSLGSASKGFRGIAFSGVSEWGSNGSGSPIPSNLASSLSPSLQSPREEESIIKIGNELVLVVSPEGAGSNPSSPRASRRLSTDMASITRSRPVSQVSKRSSLPASNRNSIIEVGTPVQVTIKAATLERLGE